MVTILSMIFYPILSRYKVFFSLLKSIQVMLSYAIVTNKSLNLRDVAISFSYINKQMWVDIPGFVAFLNSSLSVNSMISSLFYAVYLHFQML